MTMYLGDFAAGATVEFSWNAFSGLGGSITRATDGAIRIYKGHSVTQRTSAAGITDSEDFDSLTGLNHVQIDLSDNTDAGFYAAGSEYQVVLQGAVIDGQTVNAVLAHFAIERTGGLAAILARLPAALVSGRIDASVGAMASGVLTATAIASDAITAAKVADGTIDAATFAAGAINAAAIAADAITDAKVASDVTIASVTGSVGSVTGAVGSVTGSVGSVTGAVGSVTGNVGGNVTGTVGSVVGSVGSVAGNVGGNVTGSVGSIAAGGIAAAAFAANALDAVWSTATRLLTAGTNIVLAKGVGVTGFNDLSAAQVNAEADTALADYDAPTHAEMTAELATADDATLAQVALVKAKTDNLPSDPADQSLIIAATDSLATAIAGISGSGTTAADVWAVAADGKTMKEHMLLQSAVMMGQGANLEDGSASFAAIDGSKTRVSASVDADAGTRGAPTLDAA